jgi:hypothetical protein
VHANAETNTALSPAPAALPKARASALKKEKKFSETLSSSPELSQPKDPVEVDSDEDEDPAVKRARVKEVDEDSGCTEFEVP